MAAEQPKKPLTAFFLYIEDQRSSVVAQLGEQAKVKGMVIKTCSDQWKALAEDAKAPYEKKAAVAKAAYDKALENFKASGGEIVRKTKKSKDVKPKKDKDAPKKPAGGGYGQYLSQHRNEIAASLPAGSNPISDVAKVAGERWKALSEAEKKPYLDSFVEKMKEYRTAMEAHRAANPVAEEEDEKEEEEEKTSTPKRKKATEDSDESPAKRAKNANKARVPKAKAKVRPTGARDECEFDSDVMKEAKKLGFDSQLRNLANRDDVKALAKKDADLLAALRASNGLVNPARRTLLGA